MKKVLTIILSVVLIFSIATIGLPTITVRADTEYTEGYYTYTVANNKAKIIDVSSNLAYNNGHVEIPETLGGYPVVDIGISAFYNGYRMKSVTIPATVKSIDSSAFTYNYNLNNIKVDENNTEFSSSGGVLFNKDKTVLLTFPAGNYCDSYTVPESVIKIEEGAFKRCKHLYQVVLSDNIESIGKFAFADCIYLENIYIPSSVNTINYGAFGVLSEEEAKRSLIVYYQGSQHEKPEINIAQGNDFLLKSEWRYSQCGISRNHSFDNNSDYSCNVCNYTKINDSQHSFTINDGLTCDICLVSKTPNTPIAETVTNNSVVLKSVSYLEYSKDNVNWQEENVFNGLNQETEYMFYQRVKNSSTSLASESSAGLSVTTRKNIYISFNANGGVESLETQIVAQGIPTPLLSQIPTRNGYVFAGWGTFEKCGKQYLIGKEYVFDKDITLYALWYDFFDCKNCENTSVEEATCSFCDGTGEYATYRCRTCTGVAFPVHTTSSNSIIGFDCGYCGFVGWSVFSYYWDCGTCSGTGIVNVICSVCNGVCGAVELEAPKVMNYTDTLVNLIPQEGHEYSKDGVYWQESNIFTDLSPNTTYTFYTRMAATETEPFSPMSSGARITTDKSKQILTPVAPTIQSSTSSSITLNAVDGCEYSTNGTTWQSSNVFNGLSCGTEYTFYQRYKETVSHYASKPSASVIFKTDKGTQSSPYSPTVYDKSWDTITLYERNGYEYSKDGINWQSSNIFVGLSPETNYIFYQRKAETDTHYASPASTSLSVKTSEAPECYYDALKHQYNNSCDTQCNLCGVTRTITHDYENATCVEPKTCKVCGNTEGVALGHDYADATCTAPKTCSVCGTTSGNKLSHKSDSGTVTKKATCTATGIKTYKCTLCKATIKTDTIAKVAHKYDSGKVTKAATCKVTGVKTYTCSVCKGTKTETIAKLTTHTYSNNCDKSCNVCGKTRTVGAHKYSNNCDTTCNYCSAKRTIKHTYSNNCDTSCNVCKATRTITHTYKTTTTKATLTKNGSVVKKCTVCGKVASNTAIKYAKTFKLSTTTYTYDGKVKTPTVTVKDSAGKTLKKNTDYTVTYASGRKNVGTYKVTIKMKGKYSGTKTLTFKINPAKTTVSKLTAGKKSITVAITKKSTQVTGYQIQYSTSKTFSKATTKTISSYKTTKYTLKSLSAKKTYYVRVRTYKTVGKTKYYSGWSTYKYGKTK